MRRTRTSDLRSETLSDISFRSLLKMGQSRDQSSMNLLVQLTEAAETQGACCNSLFWAMSFACLPHGAGLTTFISDSRVKRPECEGDHKPLTSKEVWKAWSLTSWRRA
jgi:hypothetical protein